MSSAPRKHPVLVVDDDVDVCSAYAEAIAEAGYDVVAVHDGKQALEWLRESEVLPCVILLDLMMPVIDGRQFVRDLRTGDGELGVPIVVVTAHRGESEVQADDFLQKPASLEALLSMVRRFCGCAKDDN